jgi:hypothetical protein
LESWLGGGNEQPEKAVELQPENALAWARLADTGQAKIRYLVFDFRRVSGFDSSAVISFVKCRQISEAQNIMLVLTHLSPRMQKRFEMEGLAEGQAGIRFFPDLDHGRICAQNNAQLDTIIHKMLNMERNPSTNAGFYSNPIVAAAWQTERWFQLAGEVVRQFLMLGLGKTPATTPVLIVSHIPIVSVPAITIPNCRFRIPAPWLRPT